VLLSALRTRFANRHSAAPIQGSGLWLDQHELAATVDPSVQGNEVRGHLQDLIVKGYTHVPGAVSRAECDELVSEFDGYCTRQAEAEQFADEHGNHSRLCNFHMHSDVARSIGLNPRVLAILDAAFARPAAICSSLLFEKGSQQAIHRDTLFFHTKPVNQFFGVWTALEDVVPDAGPLAYYIGGHRFHIDSRKIAETFEGQTTGVMYNAYMSELHRMCKQGDFPFTHADFMQKGDVLIWHPQLPHGGSPITRPGATRRSIVFHYMPHGCAVHGVDAFFSDVFPESDNPLLDVCGRSMINQGLPQFLSNY
jgi:phytanoyl-CoA dioxygenase PhyH